MTIADTTTGMTGTRGTTGTMGKACNATVDLVYFNAGGGHRAAAQALEQAIHAQGLPWRVRKLNLAEMLDPGGLFKRVTGFAPEDLYNKRLASGFTLGLAQELKLLQGLIRVGHGALVQRLARHWQAARPDLVVSLIPNFNRALHDGLATAGPAGRGPPFVTVLTDMADHPPHFWIEPGIAQHVVCGTEHAALQALAAGCAPRFVHRTSGMLLRPEFHLREPLDRAAERRAVGLDDDTPTGLVLFGGAGSRVMKHIAARLPRTPLILICGRNKALADALREMTAGRPQADLDDTQIAAPRGAVEHTRGTAPRVVLGDTRDVARWMRLADFFIGKPGPGSLSEAVQQGLPVIVTRNAWTMPQERWNTQWVQQHGLGSVQRSFATVQAAVDEITADMPALKRNVGRMQNRAVFEVPQVLARILNADEGAGACTQAPATRLRLVSSA